MFRINIISLMILLCLPLTVITALSQDLPISDNTLNTPELPVYQTAAPSAFSLSQNYREPFTIIKFRVEKYENVKLMVVNEYGREVITIINKSYNPGSYEIKLDASDLGAGVFFCKISTSLYSETKKMVLAK